MKALTFITSAIAAGLLLGFAIVATIPSRTTPATARALGKPMPDLVGQSLADAEALLDQRSIDHDTIGGGLFGIVFSEDWMVCSTSPPGPAFLRRGESVDLVVDRYC
jgi:hypothetical protein